MKHGRVLAMLALSILGAQLLPNAQKFYDFLSVSYQALVLF